MPKASVCLTMYNQKGYIRECLQSLVDRKTDFDRGGTGVRHSGSDEPSKLQAQTVTLD